MASHQWVPPLPAGYEARWDPNQRAYFFINHLTKTTTWVDPRFSSQAPQQATGGHHQAAAQYLNQSGGYGGNQGGVNMTTMYKQFGTTTTTESDASSEDEFAEESFDHLFTSSQHQEETKVNLLVLHELKQAFPSAPEQVISDLLKQHNNGKVKVSNMLHDRGYRRVAAASHPPPKVTDMLERLQAMFMSANKELIADMLEACNNDEKQTREMLESMGYTAVFPQTHRNASARGGNARHTAQSKSPSPAKTPQRRRSPSPAKKQVSASEKRAMLEKFRKNLPNVEKNVIEMALEVCDYDEMRVKNVLDGMVDSGTSRPSTSTSRPGTSYSRVRSPSPTPVVSSASLEPVVLFEDDFGSRPSTSSTTRGGSTTPVGKRSSDTGSRPTTSHSSKSTTSRRTPATSQSKPASRPTAAASQQTRAKQVTHTVDRVITRQPGTSSYHTEAKGPDPSLCVGPNKNLLLTEYVPALGPDPSRVQGSQGAVGSDSSLACGPQYHLRKGPDAAARSDGHGRPMVTAI